MTDEPSSKPDGHRQLLHTVLLTRYDALRAKLTQRLGSADLAGDALQDTWLRLQTGGGGKVGAVRDPFAFLIRIASNVASNSRTLDQRRARILERHAVDIPLDDAPDPERVTAARSELAAIKRLIADLPERRQAIFLAAWVEEIPYEEIAKKHGVSVRTIQSEVKQTIEYCAAALSEK